MYAIIQSGGRQYWVVPGEILRVNKLDAQPGQEITLKALWAAADAQGGSQPPTNKAAKVVAEVLRQGRGAKVLVFKKRPKSMYRRTQGHRQAFTEIRIKEISLN